VFRPLAFGSSIRQPVSIGRLGCFSKDVDYKLQKKVKIFFYLKEKSPHRRKSCLLTDITHLTASLRHGNHELPQGKNQNFTA
jgi:hypothetical protein